MFSGRTQVVRLFLTEGFEACGSGSANISMKLSWEKVLTRVVSKKSTKMIDREIQGLIRRSDPPLEWHKKFQKIQRR
ncbi:hypothetical protein OCU04_009036 [Sclerotinia nivalis]|uniref:Uncharacterized protein n=1 Tax=Sclerotinia nivalis TaxID=352851 RepID=A0A9X0DGC6_9HELO|nr:hypothetical protein OCU04_009036 [Sclerotinia nivalis]